MSELKTLKDMENIEIWHNGVCSNENAVDRDELRQEAIKHIKHYLSQVKNFELNNNMGELLWCTKHGLEFPRTHNLQEGIMMGRVYSLIFMFNITEVDLK